MVSGIVLGVAILFVTGFLFLQRSASSSLPDETIKSASRFMKVYYYSSEPPHNFKLDENSISLSGAILMFQLENDKKQRVSVTEQALPDELQNSKVESGERVEGAPGSATVTFKEGRTIGTLLTQDKQTMIMANSSDGIDTSAMKDLIRSLKPLQD